MLCSTRQVLLLFDDIAPTAPGYAKLSRNVQKEETRRADHLAVHLVVPHTEAPRALARNGSVLLDPGHALHIRFGAGVEGLCLVRRDG